MKKQLGLIKFAMVFFLALFVGAGISAMDMDKTVDDTTDGTPLGDDSFVEIGTGDSTGEDAIPAVDPNLVTGGTGETKEPVAVVLDAGSSKNKVKTDELNEETRKDREAEERRIRNEQEEQDSKRKVEFQEQMRLEQEERDRKREEERKANKEAEQERVRKEQEESERVEQENKQLENEKKQREEAEAVRRRLEQQENLRKQGEEAESERLRLVEEQQKRNEDGANPPATAGSEIPKRPIIPDDNLSKPGLYEDALGYLKFNSAPFALRTVILAALDYRYGCDKQGNNIAEEWEWCPTRIKELKFTGADALGVVVDILLHYAHGAPTQLFKRQKSDLLVVAGLAVRRWAVNRMAEVAHDFVKPVVSKYATGYSRTVLNHPLGKRLMRASMELGCQAVLVDGMTALVTKAIGN